jgi:hypothetical protein
MLERRWATFVISHGSTIRSICCAYCRLNSVSVVYPRSGNDTPHANREVTKFIHALCLDLNDTHFRSHCLIRDINVWIVEQTVGSPKRLSDNSSAQFLCSSICYAAILSSSGLVNGLTQRSIFVYIIHQLHQQFFILHPYCTTIQ